MPAGGSRHRLDSHRRAPANFSGGAIASGQSNPNRAEPSRGETADRATVRLSPDQLKQIGLETAVLKAAPHPEQFRAYGTVVDIARITELTNSYANAQAQLQTAQAKFEVAKSAFERTKNLVQSAALPKKEAEAAEGTFRTDQAALAAAELQVQDLGGHGAAGMGPGDRKGDHRAIAGGGSADRT